MFKSIHLGNFKAFAETQKAPLKPLTLIFGANSAGKSSLIHGLLFAHEAHTNDEADNLNVGRTKLGGDSVDLGGFRQFVHRRISEKQVEWGVEIDTSLLEGKLGETLRHVKKITIRLQIGLLYSANTHSAFADRSRVNIQSYEINTGEKTLLRASIKKKGKSLVMGLDELDDENPVIREIVKAIIETATTTDKFKEEDNNTTREVIDTLAPKLILDMGNFLPKGVSRKNKSEDSDFAFEELHSHRREERAYDVAIMRAKRGMVGEDPVLMSPISKGNRKEDITKALEFFIPRTLNDFIKELNEYVGVHLGKLNYLGPLRSYPARHIAFTQDYDVNWHSGGGYAWDLVKNDSDVRDKVNMWLSSPERMKTPYTLQVEKLVSPEANYDVFRKAISKYFEIRSAENIGGLSENDRATLDEIGSTGAGMTELDEHWDADTFASDIIELLLSEEIEGTNVLTLVDKRNNTVVSHRDVGIGVSQVLPVLVSAYSAENEILMMEQPELHLHPALQAELGDVFVESAIERKNTLILETHSEHLILRLLRRIRETADGELPEGLNPLTPDDICILYIKPSQRGSEIIEIHVTEDGEFKEKWPDGFFAERAEELF